MSLEKVPVDEVLINGRRYRVPERVIVLGFWSKVRQTRNGGGRPTCVILSFFPVYFWVDWLSIHSPKIREVAPTAQSNASSPLTSLSSLPDVDSPPPSSSITSVPCQMNKEDADDITRIAEVSNSSTNYLYSF